MQVVTACHEIAVLKDELKQLKSDNLDLTDENQYQPLHCFDIVHCITLSSLLNYLLTCGALVN